MARDERGRARNIEKGCVMSIPVIPNPAPALPRGRWAILRRPWFWVIVALVFALVLGWVMAFYNSGASQSNASSVAELRGANQDLQSRLGTVSGERDELLSGRAAAEGAVKKREDAVKAREDELAQREGAVKKREDDVKAREDAVTQQEKVQAQNTIAEGSWAVGVDVQPGTYRTKEAVTGDCYWEINSDANGDHIVANDIVTGGRPTVTLKNGQFFKTARCGEWGKV
jgi:hypothetical protein